MKLSARKRSISFSTKNTPKWRTPYVVDAKKDVVGAKSSDGSSI